jgi:conserved oligomeric Golgi complex subunit 1
VLARLLHKLLLQQEPASQMIESLRIRISSLRRKLLSVIDRRLSDSDSTWRSLVEDMCAFSLTTNTTPTDILRHFHRVRLNAIETSLTIEQEDNTHALQAVKHLISTLRVSQTIFPKRLSDALGRLKDVPLLQNNDVILLDELDLNIHEPWVPEELRNYTPWPRHDELKEPEAKKLLKTWALQALQTLTSGLRVHLSKISSFELVIRLRESVFQALPWGGKDLPGLFVPDVIDEFRTMFNERLGVILKVSTQGLESLVSTMSESLGNVASESVPSLSLWDDEITSTDASNGALKLKTTLRSFYRGGDPISSAFIREYDGWSEKMSSLASSIKALRDDKWNDDLGDDLDEADGDSRKQLLGEDDPKTLEDSFTKQLQSALDNLRTSLETHISDVVATPSSTSISKVIVTLRIFRSILHHSAIINANTQPISLEPSKLTPLHTLLATHVTSTPLSTYATSLTTLANATVLPLVLLWEGTPPLPVQPSPSAYRLLRDVQAHMQSCGADVWAPGAVRAVKDMAMDGVRKCVEMWLDDAQEQKPAEQQNGSKIEDDEDKEEVMDVTTEGGEISDEKRLMKEKTTQVLFDTLYLRQAVRNATNTNSIDSIVNRFCEAGDLDTAMVSRMEKGATEYWRRTYLMFALLAT